MKNNLDNCRSYFQFCKNGWHYEKNFLGQKVSIHYKIDSITGKRLTIGGLGCVFEEDSPENWGKLVMTLQNAKKIRQDNTTAIYELSNGQIGKITNKQRPYADDIISFAVSNLIFKGTSCEIKGLDNP